MYVKVDDGKNGEDTVDERCYCRKRSRRSGVEASMLRTSVASLEIDSGEV